MIAGGVSGKETPVECLREGWWSGRLKWNVWGRGSGKEGSDREVGVQPSLTTFDDFIIVTIADTRGMRGKVGPCFG